MIVTFLLFPGAEKVTPRSSSAAKKSPALCIIRLPIHVSFSKFEKLVSAFAKLKHFHHAVAAQLNFY